MSEEHIPMRRYTLDEDGIIIEWQGCEPEACHLKKKIGNYFTSIEEAERAVMRLEALQRLKEHGFKFEGVVLTCGLMNEVLFDDFTEYPEKDHDLSLLFGEVSHNG